LVIERYWTDEDSNVAVALHNFLANSYFDALVQPAANFRPVAVCLFLFWLNPQKKQNRPRQSPNPPGVFAGQRLPSETAHFIAL